MREAFLATVCPISFVYYAFTLDKRMNQVWGEAYRSKGSFYMTVSKYVFDIARPHLNGSYVVMDDSGSRDFQHALAKYVRNAIKNGDDKLIKKFRAERSSQNNLLQLADYVASICHRVSIGKADASTYHGHILPKEIQFKKWPK